MLVTPSLYPKCYSVTSQYTMYLASSGLSPGSIKTYLAAVRHLQIASGLPEPRHSESMAKLCLVETRAKKEYSKPSRPWRPITPVILRGIREIWSPNATEFDVIMLWAAVCVCFFGFFRSGEITTPSEAQFNPNRHLTVADLAWNNPADPQVLRI